MKTHPSHPLIKALLNPDIYPHPCKDFEVIETHISWVILTGTYAYKIKKTLDLGFLDFSTLEKRHRYCREELRLNSRLAPDIYLDVISIHGDEEHPQLGNGGPVIEYAVKMLQFNRNDMFDSLLAQGKLTSEHIRQTAEIIAGFHQQIARSPNDTEFGYPESVIQPVRENFEQIKRLNNIDHPEQLEEIERWSETTFKRIQTLIRQRKQEGFVRECHGDLHLANIALIDETVTPFDGIEFNPSLYWIDVVSETAFLVMDLIEKKRADLAFQFLNDYLQYSADFAGLKVIRFYLVYRAMVRAKVAAIKASQTDNGTEKQQSLSEYRNYLQLAANFTNPAKPVMFLMYGVSGSGKSWLSGQIPERLPCIRIRSDLERKRLFGLSLQAGRHGVNIGPYSAQARLQTYRRLHFLARKILLAGFCVIIDATFLRHSQRKPFLELAEELGVPFRIIATRSDIHILQQRIESRALQQNNISDADLQVLKHQQQVNEPLAEEERTLAVEVDTERHDDLTKLWSSLDEFEYKF